MRFEYLIKSLATIVKNIVQTLIYLINWIKANLNVLVQLAMLLITFALFILALNANKQTNTIINESRKSSSDQKDLTIKMKDAVQQSNALLDSMKKSIGGINTSMKDSREIVSQISPQVEEISGNLKSVNSLILEQKRLAEEELNKKASLALRLGVITEGSSGHHYMFFRQLFIQNLTLVSTRVESVQIFIPDTIKVTHIGAQTSLPPSEKMQGYIYMIGGYTISPLGFQPFNVNLEIRNPLNKFSIHYKIFHSYEPNEGDLIIPYTPVAIPEEK